jgi:hypothetical protein
MSAFQVKRACDVYMRDMKGMPRKLALPDA